MARKKKPEKAAPVASHRHRDKRKNIPAEELRGFVRADEENYPTMLYPRDPSLDPQLVWKGKDEQDRQPLEARVVTGENRKDKAAKVETARTLWAPAINNHGGFGRWAFVEIRDPWNAVNAIRALFKGVAIDA